GRDPPLPLRRLAERLPAQLAGRGDDRQGCPGLVTTFEELPPGESGLPSARPGPDLAAVGYVEREYVARGTAVSYAGHEPATFATRVAVRRPESPGSFSGTVVVEWLNVSSGSDAAPDWTYLSDEIVRRGHAWVGVCAQHVGVEGGAAGAGGG